MFGKLAEAKQKADEIKVKLAAIKVTGVSADGRVKVVADGNRNVCEVNISPEIFNESDKSQLEQKIVEATADALSQADGISAAEMRQLFGALPGMGNLFK